MVVDFDRPKDVDVADVVVAINKKDDFDTVLRQSDIPGKGLDVEPGPIPKSDAYTTRMRTTPRESMANFLYAKSKGHLLQLDVRYLVIRPADRENETHFGVSGVPIEGILSGQVKSPSDTSTQLNSTLNALEQPNLSLSGLPKAGNCPGDRRIRAPRPLR